LASIQIAALSKSYGEVQVLRGMDLDIEDGEFVVLVGPSGCGKSTLLRLIAGLEDADGGEIRIGDRIVNELAPKDRDIAMVFQSYALYPHMTVRQNLSFSLQLRGMPKDKIDAAVRAASEKLGIEELLQRKPRALSGGQRQRVAMGRALVREPKAFLFDEPLSNLDARLREQMRYEIRKLQRELGTTALYVTHDQIEAMTMADRIVAMNAGVAEQIGTPAQLYDDPANLFVAGFMGSPAMNFVDVSLRDDEHGVAVLLGNEPLGRLAAPLEMREDRRAVLGIRPERIALGAPVLGLPGRIELLEPTGPGTIVHLRVGPQRLKAFATDRLAAGVGDAVGLAMAPADMLLFDPVSGLRMR
jgi:multiple sugar transport system ATP-binding protein